MLEQIEIWRIWRSGQNYKQLHVSRTIPEQFICSVPGCIILFNKPTVIREYQCHEEGR